MSGLVLVTGAGGYLGGRVATALAHAGRPLRLVTRSPAALRPFFSESEILPWPEPSGFDGLCRDVHAVVHLASLNESDSACDPEQATLVNTLNTLQLLRAAERAKVERFVYASTARVYGEPLQGTISETTLPRPVHPYAITHLGAEHHVLAAHDRWALGGVVLRLSNVVGAPSRAGVNRWSLIANDLCRQAVTKRTLSLKSSGLGTRDFVAMSDACRAIQHVLDLPFEGLADGLFNVGGGQSRSILDMARLVADGCERVLGFRPDLLRGFSSESDAALDYRIDKLTGTGFQLAGALETEIDETLALCRDAFGKPE
jgi:UDP-glucose 4-epimerase